MKADVMTKKFERFISLYLKNDFRLKNACEAYGMSYKTYLEWRKIPEFMEMFDRVRQGIVDEAEEVVRKEISKGNLDAAKFALTRLGRNRNWDPIQNVDITSGGNALPTQINIIIPKGEEEA